MATWEFTYMIYMGNIQREKEKKMMMIRKDEQTNKHYYYYYYYYGQQQHKSDHQILFETKCFFHWKRENTFWLSDHFFCFNFQQMGIILPV